MIALDWLSFLRLYNARVRVTYDIFCTKYSTYKIGNELYTHAYCVGVPEFSCFDELKNRCAKLC